MTTAKKMNRSVLLFLSIFLLLSCNNRETSKGNGTETVKLLPLTNSPENPSSIFLKLVDKTESDSTIAYTAKGLYEGDTVGFVVEANKAIPAGINKDGSVNEKDGFKTGVIRFKSSGPESDRFVAALAKLWQAGNTDKMKTEAIQPLVFSSNKKAVDLNKVSTNSFKLFFDKDSPNPGEIFFVLDTYKRSIQFQEKDPQYRPAIMHAFAE